MSYEQRFRKTDESKGVKEQISNYPSEFQKYQPSEQFRAWEQNWQKPQQLPLNQNLNQNQNQNIPISQLDISKYLPQNQPESFYSQQQPSQNFFEFGQRERLRDPFESQNENWKANQNPAAHSPLEDLTRPIGDRPEIERKDLVFNEKGQITNEEKLRVEEETRQKINHFIEKTKEFLQEAERKMLAKYAEAREAISNIHLDQTKAQLSHAYDVTKEKIGNIAESIVESTKEELGLAKMAIEYTYENLKEGVGEFAGKVSETTRHGVDVAKHGVDVAKDKIVDFTTHKIPEEYVYVKDKMADVSHKAMEMYEATKEKVMHASEDLVDKTKELLRPNRPVEPLDETIEKLAERLKEDQEKERLVGATGAIGVAPVGGEVKKEEGIVTRKDQFNKEKL